MAQIIKRGVLQSFNPATYTASILIIEATSAFLAGVPVSNSIDGTSAVPNAFCAVLFFDEHNYTDAVIIAIYPNGSVGVPSPQPGRTVSVPAATIINGVTEPASTVANVAIAGASGTGVPANAHAVLLTISMYSAILNAQINVYPYAGTSFGYIQMNEPAPNVIVTSSAIVPLGFTGGIGYVTYSIGSNGSCTIYFTVTGYIA